MSAGTRPITLEEAHQRAQARKRAREEGTGPALARRAKRRRSRITSDRFLIPTTVPASGGYLHYADSAARWIDPKRAAEALKAPGGVLRYCPNVYCRRATIQPRCPDCQTVMAE